MWVDKRGLLFSSALHFLFMSLLFSVIFLFFRVGAVVTFAPHPLLKCATDRDVIPLALS